MLLVGSVNLFPDKTFFVQLALFAVVLFFLSKFVFGPILKTLQLRKEKNLGAQKKIEEMAKKTQEMISEYEEKMGVARNQAHQIRESIRREGAEQGAHLVSEAKASTKIQIEKAKTEIQASAAQASAQLQEKVKELGLEVAEKILERKINTNGH